MAQCVANMSGISQHPSSISLVLAGVGEGGHQDQGRGKGKLKNSSTQDDSHRHSCTSFLSVLMEDRLSREGSDRSPRRRERESGSSTSWEFRASHLHRVHPTFKLTVPTCL